MKFDTKQTTALSAVTATTTSSAIQTNGSKAISVYLTAASIASGNGVFTADVSADGITWVAYNKFITNVTNTNAQNLVRAAGATLSSNTSVMISVSPEDAFNFIRITVTRTTDGAYTAVVVQEF